MPETADAEFVSLEDAEAEQQGKKPAARGRSRRRRAKRKKSRSRREPRRRRLHRGRRGRRRRRDRHHRRRRSRRKRRPDDSRAARDSHMRQSISRIGAIAQLGERLHGMQEVGGSIPPGSTNLRSLRELRLGKPPARAAFLLRTRLLTAIAAALHDAAKPGRNAMQGKIALEEHFAIEATLGDSQVFGVACVGKSRPAPARHPGHAPEGNGQARDRDDDPVAQRAGGAGDPRRQARDRGRQAGQRRPRRRSAQAPRPASPLSPRCRCRTRTPRPPSSRAASRSSASSARWSTASRRPARPTTSLYYDLPQYRPFWRAVEALDVPFYLHPRNPLPSWTQVLRGPQLAARPELGLPRGNRRACAAADRQRPVRRMSEIEDGARPSRRRHSGLSLAHRRPQRLDEGAAQIPGQARRRPLFPQALPSHHVGQFQHAGAGQRRLPRWAPTA